MSKRIVVLVLVALTCSYSWAVDVFSHTVGGSGSSTTSYTETPSGGGIGIDITVSLGAGTSGRSTLTIIPLNAGDTPIEWLNVTATSGTANRYLVVNVDCSGTFPTKRVSYIKAAQRTSGSSRPVNFACADVGQLGVSGSSTTFSFSSYALMRIKKDAGEGHTGNVYADIVATRLPSSTETGASGNFDDSFTVQGDFLSSISTAGYVNPLVVTGVLGSTSRPASLTAIRFARIDAASFEGEIDATGTSGSDGIGQVTITGDAIGTIVTERIGTAGGWPGVWTFGGDLDADVLVRGDVDAESTASPATVVIGGEFKAGRVFVIGGTLAGGASGVGGIKVTDTAGLKGQIVINANDASDDWLGDATVGATVLDPGGSGTNFAYTTTSTTLGGGSVGLVPYHLHKTDCLPPHSPTGMCDITFPLREWPDESERETIILRHYGPVFDSLGNDPKPVIVYLKSRDLCTPTPCPGEYGVLTSWTDKTTYFDVHVPGDGSREVWVSRVLDGNDDPQAFNTDYHTKIDLVLHDSVTQLRSDATLAATAPQVGGYPYILETWCEMLMGPRPLEEE